MEKQGYLLNGKEAPAPKFNILHNFAQANHTVFFAQLNDTKLGGVTGFEFRPAYTTPLVALPLLLR